MDAPQIILLLFLAVHILAGLVAHGARVEINVYLAVLRVSGLLVLLTWGGFFSQAEAADSVPQAAEQHRRTLVRSAHAEWGLDAPIATFAAQVHQESHWNSTANSKAGAQGLAQFMPATAQWMAQSYPELGKKQPYSPAWSLRAMVLYDSYLFARNSAVTACERWAMTMAAYNGGQGWVNRDRKLAISAGDDPQRWFGSIEKHNAGRSAANFRENRDYPRKILRRWEPVYIAAGWGDGACAPSESAVVIRRARCRLVAERFCIRPQRMVALAP
jgi:soluble lytic murein transglycosylase-like protein